MSTQPAPQIDLSIVMPAYNERDRIGPTLAEYVAHFGARFGERYELIVVLNGCVDDTRGVVEEVAARHSQVRLIEFERPLGKGGAIWEGFAAARGSLLVFADADNMVRAPEADRLVRMLDDYDLAIADRFNGQQEGGRSSQPPLRRLISAASRLWIRRFLGLPFSDPQCGAKAIRAAAWRTIAPRVAERSWAFDLDVLAQSQALGMRTAEVPVRWRHIAEGSKVRPWKDVPQTLLATVRVRKRARR